MSNGKKALVPVMMEQIESELTKVYDAHGFFDMLTFANGMKFFANEEQENFINGVIEKKSNEYRNEVLKEEQGS